MRREEAGPAAIQLLVELLRYGQWYSSAIEIDNISEKKPDGSWPSGEVFEARAREIVQAAGVELEPPT